MKFYKSKNSGYFFAQGHIQQVRNGKRTGVFLSPSYNEPNVVRQTAQKTGITDLKGEYDPETLETFMGALKEKAKQLDQPGGIFITTEIGQSKGRIIHTGLIRTLEERSMDELAKFMKE